MKVKNVIFDLGGVVLEGTVKTFVDAIRQENPDCDATLYDVAKNEHWERWDNGLIDSNELIAELAKKHNKDHLLKLFALIMAPTRPFSQECIGIIENLFKKGFHVYVLSNLSKEMHQAITTRNPELFNSFNGMVFSHQIGHGKPSAILYRHLLKTHELIAEESIFIDDSAKNVKAAEELNIAGILYEPGKLEEALTQHSITLS